MGTVNRKSFRISHFDLYYLYSNSNVLMGVALCSITGGIRKLTGFEITEYSREYYDYENLCN